jgi:hypothetical protein
MLHTAEPPENKPVAESAANSSRSRSRPGSPAPHLASAPRGSFFGAFNAITRAV